MLSAFVMDGTTIVNARVYPVHLMNAEQHHAAADLGLSQWASSTPFQAANVHSHHRHFYYYLYSFYWVIYWLFQKALYFTADVFSPKIFSKKSPKIRGPSPKEIVGPKHAKFGPISYNFRFWSRISPERDKISKIRKTCDYHDSSRVLWKKSGELNLVH